MHFIMRGLSGVFQVGFNTRTSGVVISLGFLIPPDILRFTAAKIWPPLSVRWVCVKAVLEARISCVAAERETGDACGVVPAAPPLGSVCGHPSVGPAAPSNPVAHTQCEDKNSRFCQQEGFELTSNTPVWYD